MAANTKTEDRKMNWKVDMHESRTAKEKERPIKTRFFKIIMEDDLESGNLHLPNRFVRLHGIEIYSEVNVVLRKSSPVKVSIENPTGTELFLGKGWEKLTKQYNVKNGHWLLFTYKGGSQLKLKIFDKTCTQIKYPIHCYSSQVQDRQRNITWQSVQQRREAEKKKDKSCFFKVLIFDDQLSEKLRIPKVFTDSNKERLTKKMKIRIGTRPIWEVEVEKDRSGMYCIKKGWKEISTAYSLALGYFMFFRLRENSIIDAIIFDRTVMEIDYPMNVSGYVIPNQVKRSSNDQGESSRNAIKKQTCRKIVNQGEENGNTFKLTLKAEMFNRFDQTIPKSTMVHTMIEASKTWKLNFEGITWEVNILVSGYKRKFSKGWRRFVEENKNKLSDGTVLEFTVNDGANASMDVVIAT